MTPLSVIASLAVSSELTWCVELAAGRPRGGDVCGGAAAVARRMGAARGQWSQSGSGVPGLIRTFAEVKDTMWAQQATQQAE